MLDIGEEAPDFELSDQNGDSVALSDYHGQRVVLYFYPRANTEGCTTQACSFRDNWDRYEDLDIAVLGVSDDTVSDLKKFEEDHDLPVRFLSDENGEVSTVYESYGEKKMFGNTFDGVFRNTYVIDEEGTIELAYEGVDPEEHAETILADLDLD
ncbi:thioredoxin-dependent thiol peroxidase [Haloarchaeobius sp. HME9146]|uniref:thioredoxin-dependent thiol peroxidase n=1 Tax=Haloarchaeobius sp. HME9146 TaxID=2978732 RepID=UPI0021BE2C27|nr:thioredoxin-dependent thiol peroxidase [Haloarchaeobius sp. HME9146]MCT9097132.1 thioredoxin-dependent thiol peroxidase [Haloarchaeobius sp. HME9146]